MLLMPVSSLLALSFLSGCLTPKESAPQDPKDSKESSIPTCTLYDLNPAVVPMGAETEVQVTLSCDQENAESSVFSGIVDASGQTIPFTRVDAAKDRYTLSFAYTGTAYGATGAEVQIEGGESVALPLSVYHPSPDASLSHTLLDQLPSKVDWRNWTESEDGLAWETQAIIVDNDNGWQFIQGEVREGVVQAIEETGSPAPGAFGRPRGKFVYGKEGDRVFSARQLETARASLLIRKRIDKSSPLIAAQPPTDTTAEWPGDSEVGADLLDMVVVSTEGDAVVLGTAVIDQRANFVLRDESTGKDIIVPSISGMTPDSIGTGNLGLLRRTGEGMAVVASDQVLIWAVSPGNKCMDLYEVSGNAISQIAQPVALCFTDFAAVNPVVQTADVDLDGNLDLALMATDANTEQEFVQIWPGDGTKMPWGIFGSVLGLNTTKDSEQVPLSAMLETQENNVHVVDTAIGPVLVQITDGQVGLDGQYIDNTVNLWSVDALMAGEKPEAMTVPTPKPSWHAIQGGSLGATGNAAAAFLNPPSTISISGGSILFQDHSGFDNQGISVRLLDLGTEGDVYMSTPTDVQTTTVRARMTVRYNMNETSIGVMDGNNGTWTPFSGVSLDGVSWSGHDSFAIASDSPIFIAPQGVQQNVLHAMIAVPGGGAASLDADAALEKIGVPSDGMTLRPIRTDLSDGLDMALFAVVPMAAPQSGDQAYIVSATPLADGWDAPTADTQLNFKLVSSYECSDKCLEAGGGGLCGVTDHFRVAPSDPPPGVLDGWTEQTVEVGTAMEALVAVLPWQTGLACEMALVYIPGVGESYKDNLAKATVLATSDKATCSDLPRPVASSSIVISGGNIEFQNHAEVTMVSSSGIQVLSLSNTSAWISPATPLPDELSLLGEEGDTTSAFGGGMDANWDGVSDLYLTVLRHNADHAAGRSVLLQSDGRGGFLPVLLDVEGAVGVVSSSPVYARTSKDDAIKSQLVEAGAVVEVK